MIILLKGSSAIATKKSIGEVRAKWELQVQFRPNEADAFSDKLNYKKKIIRKATATEKVE